MYNHLVRLHLTSPVLIDLIRTSRHNCRCVFSKKKDQSVQIRFCVSQCMRVVLSWKMSRRAILQARVFNPTVSTGVHKLIIVSTQIRQFVARRGFWKWGRKQPVWPEGNQPLLNVMEDTAVPALHWYTLVLLKGNTSETVMSKEGVWAPVNR